MVLCRSLVLIVSLLITSGALAADPITNRRLLLPIFSASAPGAFGSQFVTHLTLFNGGAEAIQIDGVYPSCPIPECISPFGILLAPNETADPYPVKASGAAPGRFIIATETPSSLLAGHLRVGDSSRSAENAGTEIPIVAEEEFAKVISLPYIVTRQNYRQNLRVYAAEPTSVRVRILDVGPGTAPREFTLALTKADPQDSLQPAYAAFSGPFPDAPGGLANFGHIQIEVRSENEVPVWAFVSTTNNDTQLITTATPQQSP